MIMNVRNAAWAFLGALAVVSCAPVTPVSRRFQDGPTREAVQGVRDRIDLLCEDPGLAPCFIGIEIVRTDDGGLVYERFGDKLFHPASNMKLLTSATALHVLHRDFRFMTAAEADAAPVKGTLPGNLYVKGSGDPLVTTEDIDSMAARIRGSGIETIEGDLVGDVGLFDDVEKAPGWMWDDEPYSYAAPISALVVDGNSVKVLLKPGPREGDSVAVTTEPRTGFVKIINAAVTSRDTLIPPVTVERHPGTNDISVRGRVPPGSDLQPFLSSIANPGLYFLQILKERLLAHGVKVTGDIVTDTSRGTLHIADISHPLDSVLYLVNKQTNNLAAENLLKTLAAEETESAGTTAAGLAIVRDYLSSIGVDTTKVILADGSGLSFYNAVSPDAVVRLLLAAFRDTSIFRRFYESLPVAGVDGTLKNRMRGTIAAGNVHAKTGTLSGVSSLSGYVTTADRKVLAFSILGNILPGSVDALRRLQDSIMVLLTKSAIAGPN